MPTLSFAAREEADRFATTIPGAYVARDPLGAGWIVVTP